MKKKLLLFAVLWLNCTVLFSQKLVKVIPHPNTVYWVDFSEDGKFIASAGKDTVGRVFDLSGRELSTVRSHKSAISTMRFFGNQGKTITTSYDNRALISDRNGKMITELAGHSSGVINLAVSPDQQMICTVSRDKTARLWKSSGELIAELTEHTEQVNYAVFIPGKKEFLTGAFDGKIHRWNYQGELLSTLSPYSSGIRYLILSLDGQTVLAGHRDGTISATPLQGGKSKHFKAHGDMVSSICFTAKGHIITSSMDPDIKVWNASFELVSSWKAHDSYVASIDIKRDLLVSCSGDGTVKIWRINF